ncbi:MAG: phage holin family protein [Succinivibrionaceae bacterium]
MENILTYISDLFLGNGIIIIIGCMILGLFIKGSTKIKNKYIPFINIAVSIILGFSIPGTFDDKDIISKIILLIFLGLSSVGLYEALCIAAKDRLSIDIKEIIGKYMN